MDLFLVLGGLGGSAQSAPTAERACRTIGRLRTRTAPSPAASASRSSARRRRSGTTGTASPARTGGRSTGARPGGIGCAAAV